MSLATKPLKSCAEARRVSKVPDIMAIRTGLAIQSESLALAGRPGPRLILENLSASYWCFLVLAVAWLACEMIHTWSIGIDRSVFLVGIALLSVSLLDASTTLPVFAAGGDPG